MPFPFSGSHFLGPAITEVGRRRAGIESAWAFQMYVRPLRALPVHRLSLEDAYRELGLQPPPMRPA